MHLFIGLTLLVYSIYASVPFWGLDKKYYLLIMPVFSLMGGFLWASIAMRSKNSDLSINGIIFDATITLSFFIMPFFFHKQDLNSLKILGLALLIIGLILLKK